MILLNLNCSIKVYLLIMLNLYLNNGLAQVFDTIEINN